MRGIEWRNVSKVDLWFEEYNTKPGSRESLHSHHKKSALKMNKYVIAVAFIAVFGMAIVHADEEDCDPRFSSSCPSNGATCNTVCSRHIQCPYKHYCCTNPSRNYPNLEGSCLSIYDIRCN